MTTPLPLTRQLNWPSVQHLLHLFPKWRSTHVDIASTYSNGKIWRLQPMQINLGLQVHTLCCFQADFCLYRHQSYRLQLDFNPPEVWKTGAGRGRKLENTKTWLWEWCQIFVGVPVAAVLPSVLPLLGLRWCHMTHTVHQFLVRQISIKCGLCGLSLRSVRSHLQTCDVEDVIQPIRSMGVVAHRQREITAIVAHNEIEYVEQLDEDLVDVPTTFGFLFTNM